MSSCCPSEKTEPVDSCHTTKKKSFDYILWPSLSLILVSYILHFLPVSGLPMFVQSFSHSSVELMNKMWWGLGFAFVFVGFLELVPRELVMAALGTGQGFKGLLRATLAGLLLDLCNHGILVIAMKLYKRGASLGQTIAFLVASPWNSFSMTIILIALVGIKWTLAFILLSCVVALISGWIFDRLVQTGRLPQNPNSFDLPKDIKISTELKSLIRSTDWGLKNILKILWNGVKDSKMILRWILFGVVLAGVIREVMSPELFAEYFGPSLAGLGFTVLGATIIEVCSEGATPVAADLVNIAKAPGNAFTFLMTGVSTDYTEIMSLKETTKSWKISLFLPLITVPQVILIGYILNQF